MRKFILVFFACSLLCGCTIQIKTLYDPTTDFRKYKTFCWMNGCDFAVSGPAYLKDSLLRENIKKSIISELNIKGLTFANDNPDLLVSFNITIENQQTILYPRHDDETFFHSLDNEDRVINYLEGTLVIGIADNKESRVVWESFANRYIDANPDLSERNIAKGIHLVLKKYPPGSKAGK